MIRLAEALSPLTDLMRILALQSSVMQAGETPVRMLVPGQGKTSTTYLWAVLGDQQFPYTTFSFTESRSRAGPARFFADFEGTLVSDAYIGYELLSSHSQGRIRIAGCHAHARRKFEELHSLGPTEQSATAMGYFHRLFDIEDELRELSDDERHEQRQLLTRPLLNEFKRWMDEQLTTLRPKHNLRRAINYMTTRWECFERFLEAGNIPFDNNASEQAVKKVESDYPGLLPLFAERTADYSGCFCSAGVSGVAATNFSWRRIMPDRGNKAPPRANPAKQSGSRSCGTGCRTQHVARFSAQPHEF